MSSITHPLPSVPEHHVLQIPSSRRFSDTSLESSLKRRKSRYQEAKECVLAAACDARDDIDSLYGTISVLEKSGINTNTVQLAFIPLKRLLEFVIAGKTISKPELHMLDISMDVPNDWPEISQTSLLAFQAHFDAFAYQFKRLVTSLPPPSDFAKASVWPAFQISNAGILCLRPTNNKGLPLCTFHDVFRRFQIRLSEPLPAQSGTRSRNRQVAAKSIRAAASLCNNMGEPFRSEGDRSQNFDECIRELFPNVSTHYRFSPLSDIADCEVDAAWLEPHGVPICLREDKREFGDTGYDIYMQVSRSYTLAVKTLKDSELQVSSHYLKQGAPMFLLCLLGSELFVSGGIYDGEHFMVEPLGEPCFMLPDFTGRRQRQLERMLYALAEGLTELRSLVASTIPVPSFPAATPRIYSSCKLYADGTSERTLTFKHRIAARHSGRLLFLATMSSTSSSEDIPVVVKLVGGPYGDQVHHFLACHDLAPILYGYACPEGAPVAYVMEYLDETWECLFDWLQHGSSRQFYQAVRTLLQHILDTLAEGHFVHGDLRSNNIMVRMNDGEPHIKVVDFDWAGKSGQVYYPAARNETVLWPGEADGPIEDGDDLQLLETWWP